jgi:hypothetical protein
MIDEKQRQKALRRYGSATHGLILFYHVKLLMIKDLQHGATALRALRVFARPLYRRNWRSAVAHRRKSLVRKDEPRFTKAFFVP